MPSQRNNKHHLSDAKTPVEYSVFPKRCFTLFQCADYSKDEYLSLLAREQHRSVEDVEKTFNTRFGGVEAFLELARFHKRDSDATKMNPDVFKINDGPQHDEACARIHFPAGFNLVMRIWGFERLSNYHIFAFDFTDTKNKHIDTPRGLVITALSYYPGMPIYPLRTAMELSLPCTAQAIRQASVEDLGQETYLIEHGVMVRIDYRGGAFQVQIPFHPTQPLPGLTMLPVVFPPHA